MTPKLLLRVHVLFFFFTELLTSGPPFFFPPLASGTSTKDVRSVPLGSMLLAVPLCAKYHIESPGNVPTAVGLTSVAITLLYLHIAQVLSGCRAVKIWGYSIGLSS
jgi:hypothetical protein